MAIYLCEIDTAVESGCHQSIYKLNVSENKLCHYYRFQACKYAAHLFDVRFGEAALQRGKLARMVATSP